MFCHFREEMWFQRDGGFLIQSRKVQQQSKECTQFNRAPLGTYPVVKRNLVGEHEDAEIGKSHSTNVDIAEDEMNWLGFPQDDQRSCIRNRLEWTVL